MKLTVNIDEKLLDNVVSFTNSSTKTEAINFALKEVDRRARLVEILREGTGASADELKSMFDPNSLPEKTKVSYDSSPSFVTPMVAEGD